MVKTKKRIRLGHFSDFHLKARDHEFMRALALIDKGIEERGVDHLVISGDVVNGSNLGVYEEFMEVLSDWGLGTETLWASL